MEHHINIYLLLSVASDSAEECQPFTLLPTSIFTWSVNNKSVSLVHHSERKEDDTTPRRATGPAGLRLDTETYGHLSKPGLNDTKSSRNEAKHEERQREKLQRYEADERQYGTLSINHLSRGK